MGAKEPRLTTQTLKVLGVLLSLPEHIASGAEIGRAAKLASGTLYPILLRLEEAGWLQSRWEVEDPHRLGRPRRRYYRLTGLGARNARSAFNEVMGTLGALAWE